MSGYDKTKTLPVDKKRFYAILKEKGTDPVKLSEELVHTRTYIYHYIGHTKGIPQYIVNHLQKWYGIKYEEYEYKEPPKPAEEPKQASEAVKIETVMVETDSIVNALKTALDSYAWRDAIARTVRFVLREEPTETMLKKIIQEAIEEKLG